MTNLLRRLALAAAIAFTTTLPIGGALATNADLGALITLSGQGTGTVNATPQINPDGRGAMCTWNQSAHTGTPSSTFAIQFFDTASGSWVTLLTSAAQTNDSTPATLTVYPGAPATANVSANAPVPRQWRVSATVGGTSPSVTATVGCTQIN
jgi:hypothetical protein